MTVRVPVGKLFSTGMDNSGNLLADGATDPHYTITSGPDGAGNAAQVTLTDRGPLPFYWLPSSGSSKWVSPQADQSATQEPPGSYVYKTTFDLTGLDPGSVQISGQMLVDDQVTDVRLNGVSLGLTAPYNTWVPVSIKTGFVPGINTLEFVVTNAGSSNNPSGLQVELTGTGNAVASTPVLTSIIVLPSPVTLNLNGQQQFTAVANDQNSNALSPQPRLTWSVASGGGTVSTTGLYSAGTTSGNATVQATSGSVLGTASVTVSANSNFSLSATPTALNLVQGGSSMTTISLSNTGGFSGSVALVASGLPAGVSASFSPASISGTTVSTLTLIAAPTAAVGTVNVTAIGTNGSTSQTATVALTVVATPILTSIVVSPNPANLVVNGTQQFTAVANDQNGNPLSPQPSFAWSQSSRSGGGSIGSTTGFYTSGTAPGIITIGASNGTVSGTATVNVTASSTDFILGTSDSLFILNGSASPTNSSGLALITSGSATNRLGNAPGLKITPIGAFGGNVALTLSGLPGGLSVGFSPASSVTVTPGTPTSLILSIQASGILPGVYPFTVTATSGTYVHTLALTLLVAPGTGVSQLSLTDLSLPPTALIQWPAESHLSNSYSVSRTGPGTPQFQQGILYLFDTSIQVGMTYTYHVTNEWVDPPVYYVVNNVTYVVYPHGIDDLGTIKVTPQESVVSDNQSVDARYDLRYSTWTFLDHNFGSTIYRGGLFAGYNADNSQVGHAYFKFALAPVPAGKTLWPVSSMGAYFTRCYAAGQATVACQTVPSTWNGSTATWDTAPPLVPASTNAMPLANVYYDGVLATPIWVHWGMGNAIPDALTGGTGTYSAALSGLNEPTFGAGGPVTAGASTVWAYFDKKEAPDNQPPCILYAYSN